jgi:GDP-L-fucose synthase
MKKILITGGCGFVGRHFIARFLERGWEVHCVDNLAPYSGCRDPDSGWPLFEPRDYRNFRFYREDCRDYFDRCQDGDIDYTFHLAAIVGGRLMIERNPLAVAEDLSIDAAYWRWACKAKPAKTVCFSSSAAYPIRYQREGSYRLLFEDMICFDQDLGMPDMTYGWAKLTSEYLARLAYERHGLKSICYRPFSGYGEDQDDSYPFPSICRRALEERNEPVLQVWGTGRQMRDFIHIEDCVRGVLATVDSIENGDAVNLSTGIFTSFIELARMAAESCGYRPEVRGMSDMPEGVFARGGDTSKQRALGFQPQIELREGVQRAVDYFSAKAKDAQDRNQPVYS